MQTVGEWSFVRLVEQFFRVLAPSNCLQCGAEGRLVCAWCVETALPEVAERCYRCNALSRGSTTCPACRRHTVIRHLWKRTDYTKIARELIHTMKFQYSSEAAEAIAAELVNTIPALPPNTLIINVPAATSHVRQRGFDHARTIAVELSRLTGYGFIPALTRSGQQRQVGSGRQTRLAQMKGVFRVRRPLLIKDASVLLVDDVLTTGATIESAALTLKAAGAKSVDAVIFASAK